MQADPNDSGLTGAPGPWVSTLWLQQAPSPTGQSHHFQPLPATVSGTEAVPVEMTVGLAGQYH